MHALRDVVTARGGAAEQIALRRGGEEPIPAPVAIKQAEERLTPRPERRRIEGLPRKHDSVGLCAPLLQYLYLYLY
jgi:hypothetical protein